ETEGTHRRIFYSELSAGTGIGRQEKLELGRKLYTGLRTGDGNDPLFQGFPEGLKNRPGKLGRLVQEKHPVMGKAYLPRSNRSSAPEDAFHTGRMMGTTKGRVQTYDSLFHQPLSLLA